MGEASRLALEAAVYSASNARFMVETQPDSCSRGAIMEYHYFRFLGRAYDELAIEGWCYIMNQRQRQMRAARKAA